VSWVTQVRRVPLGSQGSAALPAARVLKGSLGVPHSQDAQALQAWKVLLAPQALRVCRVCLAPLALQARKVLLAPQALQACQVCLAPRALQACQVCLAPLDAPEQQGPLELVSQDPPDQQVHEET
jgi:hypothetical protein